MQNPEFIPVAERFGSLVRKRRKALGLTLTTLAEKVFCSKRSLIDIEKGKGNPNLQTFYNLITFLEIDPYLVFSSESGTESDLLPVLIHLLQGRSEEELSTLYPVIKSLLEYTDKKNHFSAV